jgi:hypothetical protein
MAPNEHEQNELCEEKFKTLDKQVDNITHPVEGALARLHSKINTVAKDTSDKMAKKVSWSFMSVLIFVVLGAYSYTYTVAKDTQTLGVKTIEAHQDLATKEDLKGMKDDFNERITRMEDRIIKQIKRR